MTDRDRLVDDVAHEVEAVKAIREKVSGFRAAASQRPWSEDEADQMYGFCLRLLRRLENLLAEGVTLPPQPAEPVTLTFVVGDLYQGLCEPWDTRLVALGFARGQQVRVTIEDAATPSTLLTPAEVERRAREYGAVHYRWHVNVEELVSALTTASGTSTRTDGGGR